MAILNNVVALNRDRISAGKEPRRTMAKAGEESMLLMLLTSLYSTRCLSINLIAYMTPLICTYLDPIGIRLIWRRYG